MRTPLASEAQAIPDEGRSAPAPLQVFRAGLGRRLPRGYIRVGPATAMSAVLRDVDLSLEPLLRAEGAPPGLFEHPDNAIPFKSFCNLVARCVGAMGREDFGLLLCERVGASDLGLTGFLLQQASDVRAAVQNLVRYFHHHDRGASAFLEKDNRIVTLGYSIYEIDAPGCEQIYDGAAAVGRNIMLGLCGPRFAPIEVRLSRRRPASPVRYERFFGAPVRFEAEHTAILFDEKWLEGELPGADEALRRMLQEQIDLLEQEESGNFAEQVRRLLRATLVRRAASVDDICKLLQLTRRTLTRRLGAEGASYKELSDEIKFEIARQLLRQPAHSVTDVAFALHYSEASAFARAFRQWSGVSPTIWRARRLDEV